MLFAGMAFRLASFEFRPFICVLFFPTTHYAFLGKWQMQFLFWLSLGGCFIWWIIDIFRIKKIVNNANVELQNNILFEIKSVNIFEKQEVIKTSRNTRVRLA